MLDAYCRGQDGFYAMHMQLCHFVCDGPKHLIGFAVVHYTKVCVMERCPRIGCVCDCVA
jgi:hypothetical protein